MLPLRHGRSCGSTKAHQLLQHSERLPVCVRAGPQSLSKGKGDRPESSSSGGKHASKKISKPSDPTKSSKPPRTQQPARSSKKPASNDVQHKAASTPAMKGPGTCWRLFQLVTPYLADPGKDDHRTVCDALRKAAAKRLGCSRELPAEAIHLVRKSFDSRRDKRWVYVVDVDAAAAKAAGMRNIEAVQGQQELVVREQLPQLPTAPPTSATDAAPRDVSTAAGAAGKAAKQGGTITKDSTSTTIGSSGGWAPPQSPVLVPRVKSQHPVVVVGSGPAGLFAALTAAQAGLPVVLLERGQAVEQRGKDIGALLVRGILSPDSNLCYGEGGAGTWSDGKLTTKIGRNSDPVRRVLQALHLFGAPESILVSGKPHLGTDRLVHILRSMRQHMTQVLGVSVRFGCTVDDLLIQGDKITGVRLKDGEEIKASSVVLAVGHSARSMYRCLVDKGVKVTPKSFAMGFRIEHPQSWLDNVQYGPRVAEQVQRGKGPVPVADYKLTVEVPDDTYTPSKTQPSHKSPSNQASVTDSLSSNRSSGSSQDSSSGGHSSGPTKASSRRGLGSDNVKGGIGSGSADEVATSSGDARGSSGAAEKSSRGAFDGGIKEDYGGGGRPVPEDMRGVYSFCMCPGGQIVCTSTSEEELCINGMSFSRRNSQWANSALVVNMHPRDWQHHVPQHGPLAGVALQVDMEREGARRGGGRFVAPVQRVPDFLAARTSAGTLPSSSYRLGVRSAPLHDLYPKAVSAALTKALAKFERSLPGFVSEQALLHGVETRTSAPVRVDRSPETLQSVSIKGLYPCGEGAGYAGGIVSAAVDGLRVGEAIIRDLLGSSEEAQATADAALVA